MFALGVAEDTEVMDEPHEEVEEIPDEQVESDVSLLAQSGAGPNKATKNCMQGPLCRSLQHWGTNRVLGPPT